MKIYDYNKLTKKQISQLCSRENILSAAVVDDINNIAKQVKNSGDSALKDLTKKFDGVRLEKFKVLYNEFEEANNLVKNELKKAIKIAKKNIYKFHKNQIKKRKESKIETSKGVFCWREFKAIENVGLYIPGGTAPLFSTVLMLAIPALIAKCQRIVICTPANKKGKVAPEILWTANLLNIKEIYKIGGAQAIFALGYGTQQIKKVDKIFGPGNQYVTAAKMSISSHTAIDMPAGPSEVLVIADKNSNSRFVASDLLSQAEHGIDSQVVLVCDNKDKINEILLETNRQLKCLPRKDIARKALKNSFAILVANTTTSIEFANIYAPEHLIISLDDFKKYLPKISNAGAVFCGKYSSESFGDYASGTNHTLPTSGFAKNYSGISVADFGKWITFQEISKKGLETLGNTVETMALFEKLEAHKNAVNIRRKV